jgi:hypothetical protein
MAITFGFQDLMLAMTVEAQSGRHPPSPLHPFAARITRAHELRQQPVKNPENVDYSGFIFVARLGGDRRGERRNDTLKNSCRRCPGPRGAGCLRLDHYLD